MNFVQVIKFSELPMFEWMTGLGKKQVDFSTNYIPQFLGKMFTYLNTLYHRDIGTMKSRIEANYDFSIMPTATRNTKAWLGILTKEDGYLARTINMLGSSQSNNLQSEKTEALHYS